MKTLLAIAFAILATPSLGCTIPDGFKQFGASYVKKVEVDGVKIKVLIGRRTPCEYLALITGFNRKIVGNRRGMYALENKRAMIKSIEQSSPCKIDRDTLTFPMRYATSQLIALVDC